MNAALESSWGSAAAQGPLDSSWAVMKTGRLSVSWQSSLPSTQKKERWPKLHFQLIWEDYDIKATLDHVARPFLKIKKAKGAFYLGKKGGCLSKAPGDMCCPSYICFCDSPTALMWPWFKIRDDRLPIPWVSAFPTASFFSGPPLLPP